jgi:hypothetical protein
MPGDQELLRLIDLPSNQKDIEIMIEELKPLVALIKEVNAMAIGGKNVQGIADYKKNTAELAQGLNQVVEGQKKLVEMEEKLATARKKSDPKTRSDEEIRASEKARAENKARVDAIKAEDDAYKQLALAYGRAAAEAKKLQAVALKTGLKEDADAADVASRAAKGLSDELKKIDARVGDNRRNVGNYVEAISILDKTLQGTQAQLAAYGKAQQDNAARSRALQQELIQLTHAGQENSKVWHDIKSQLDGLARTEAELTKQTVQLQKEEQLLTTLTTQQAKGFASVSQELRFTEKALQTLRAAGLENTEAFREMRLEAAKAREEFREFAEQQKILASDAPLLTSLTVAAKGLAGAYAVGAGATALFADGNEKVEKELNRLVAVMTLLQGLQEAHELLQKRGAIAVAFNAAAQKIRNFVMTGSAETTKAQTAAEVLNTEASAANTISTEENVVAQEGQVIATDAVTVATEGSTRAMIALRFALIATGIGALLILLPLIASGMGLFAKNAKEAAKEALELDEMIQQLNETLAKQAELEHGYLSAQREGLQESLTYAEKAGKNFYELFAIRKRLAEVDAKEAAQLLMRVSGQTDINNALRKTTDLVDSQRAQLHGLQAIQETMEVAYIRGAGKMSDAQKKAAKEEIENHEKVIEIAQKRYDANLKNLTEYNEKAAALEAMDIEGEKFTEDEKRQLALVTAKVRAEAAIRANERIVGDERSSQAQIIAAMDRGLQAQLAIIAAERKAKLQDPSLTPAARAQVILEANNAEQAAIETNNEAKRKKNYEYYIRDRNARAEILKLEADDQAKADAVILADSKASYDNKLAALTDQFNARKKAIGADLGKDLNTPGMTDRERTARLAKAESDLQAIRIDYAKQYQAVVKENQEKILKSWEGYFQALTAQANAHESNELTALNNSFSDKLISAGNYERKRTEIQRKAAIERAQIEVQSAYFGVNATKEGPLNGKRRKSGCLLRYWD